MGLLLWLIFIATLAGAVYLGWQKPQTLIPLLAGAVALEISRTWYPDLGKLGAELGTVDLTRILTLTVIIAAGARVWCSQELRRELKAVLHNALTRALLIYLALGAFSVVYSVGRGKTLIELVRLLVLLALYLGICLLVRLEQARLPLQVVHWVGTALVPLALYEGLTRHFLWRAYLAEGMLARVNATFVDPNIFARYLVLAIVANLVLQHLAPSGKQRWVYFLTLLGLTGGLAATLSRSGILTLALILVGLLALLPGKRIWQPVGFLGLIGFFIAILRPTVWQRLATLKEGLGALDAQRQYLWKVAWAIFRSHPLTGVGLGGFQKTFLEHYLAWKTVPDGATLSHTTVLTIAAELGLPGLAALAWVWVVLVRLLCSLKRAGGEAYVLGAGYFLWILTVFISSQAEARFFEDPIIWIGMGLLVKLSQSREDKSGSGLETARG